MKKIVPEQTANLSKMWTKIRNKKLFFPELQEQFGMLSSKEQKLIKILDFTEIENTITVVKVTNPPKRPRRDGKSLHCCHGMNEKQINVVFRFDDPSDLSSTETELLSVIWKCTLKEWQY